MGFGSHFILVNCVLLFLGICSRGFSFVVSKASVSLAVAFLFLWWWTFLSFEYLLSLKIYIAVTIYLLMSLMLAMVFVFKDSKERLARSIETYVWFVVALIVVQQLVYLIFGVYLDVHSILTLGVYESRFESGFFSQFGLIRPTAFSVEPSNMAATMLLFLALYIQVKGSEGWRVILMLLAPVLTLSFASILVSSILLFLLVLYSNRRFRYYFLPACLLISAALVYLFYIRSVSDSDYDALGARLVIFKYLSSQSLYEHFLGNGFFAFEVPIILGSHELSNSHIRDTGFWINVYFSCGIVGTAVIAAYLYWASNNHVAFYFIVAVLFLKFDYMQPVFWFVVLSYGLLRYEKAKTVNSCSI